MTLTHLVGPGLMESRTRIPISSILHQARNPGFLCELFHFANVGK